MVRDYGVALDEKGQPCRKEVPFFGANARFDCPTFDIDMAFLFDGPPRKRSTGGVIGKKSNQTYFDEYLGRLMGVLAAVDSHGDCSVSLSGRRATNIETYIERLRLPEYSWRAKGHIDAIHGAGDDSLGTKFIQSLRRYMSEPDDEFPNVTRGERVLAQRHYDRVNRPLESTYTSNIKMMEGGLRSFTDVLWMFKLKYGISQTEARKVFGLMQHEILQHPKGQRATVTKEDLKRLRIANSGQMGIRIMMDLQFGRNPKELPDRESFEGERDLSVLAACLGHITNYTATSSERLVDSIQQSAEDVADVTNKIILWMFSRSDIQDMKRIGQVADSRDPTRAVAFHMNGTPVTLRTLAPTTSRGKPRKKKGDLEMGELDETGSYAWIPVENREPQVQGTLDKIRGSDGKTRLEDWERAGKEAERREHIRKLERYRGGKYIPKWQRSDYHGD